MGKCKTCGQEQFVQTEHGYKVCTSCGHVVEESKFDNQVTFTNNALTGQNIDLRGGVQSRFMFKDQGKDSVEKRFERAKEKVDQLMRLLNIDDQYRFASGAALRIIKYANDDHFFDKGRNLDNYVAVALYIALRLKKAPYLLIDFSDKLNVNMFKLARCYLRLAKFLGLQHQLPLIEPGLFIQRYCTMLDFPEKARQICTTAIRLVQRMKRDWMSHGRRPSSLCGAAILIASKIHGIKCSIADICQTVFVCDETIRRRLQEFKQTKTAKLTKDQFERMESKLDTLSDQEDPPAFYKARMKSKAEKEYELFQRQLEQQREIEDEKLDDNNLVAIIPNVDKEVEQVQNEVAKNIKIREAAEKPLPQKNNYTDDQHQDEDDQQDQENSQEQNKLKRKRKFTFNEKQTLSDIEDKDVDVFILSEEEQKMKKMMWQKMNKKWIEKQQFREQAAEKVVKKRKKKQQQERKKASTPYEAIIGTKQLGAVDKQQLKKLLKPTQKVKKGVPISVDQIFDAFAWRPDSKA